MIRVDMPLPEQCADCPMGHWIRWGNDSGRLMCAALEFRNGPREGAYIVDDRSKDRPPECPIVGDEMTKCSGCEFGKMVRDLKGKRKIRCTRWTVEVLHDTNWYCAFGKKRGDG